MTAKFVLPPTADEAAAWIQATFPEAVRDWTAWRYTVNPEIHDEIRITLVYESWTRKTQQIVVGYRCPGDVNYGWGRIITDDWCTRAAVDEWARQCLTKWATTEEAEIKEAEEALADRKARHQSAKNILAGCVPAQEKA